jgi:hypothetical protein
MVDVIQHLNTQIFKEYTSNIKNLLTDSGSFIIGTEMKKLDDFIGVFFGQAYNSMGLNSIVGHLIMLGFNMKDPKIYKLNNIPYGSIYEFTL